MKEWPNIGSKVTFKGTTKFWFTNIIEDANKLLEVGKEYTVSKIQLASSWCGVVLEEYPEKIFALNWFEYKEELTTNEVYKLEGRPIPKALNEYKPI